MTVPRLVITVASIILVQPLRNVHCFTTRSYDLDVPGSKPIRIIEADPGWDLNAKEPLTHQANDRVDHLETIKSNYKPFTHRGEKDDRFKHRPDFEHRTLKPDLISDRNDRFPALTETEEGNSEKLKEFLNSYAQNVKNINVQVDNSNVDNNDDLLHLDDKFVDLPSEEHVTDIDVKPEKSKSWNLLHFDKIQRPQDHKEWVAMEAVPWSVSKISKWHGKPKKDKYQNQNNHHGFYDSQNSRPYNDRFSQITQPEFIRPTFPKPLKPIGVTVAHRPTGFYDDPLEEGDVEDSEDDYYNKKPSYQRPSATYGHKVNLHTVQTYGHSNGNKRPYNDNCNNHHVENNHHHSSFNHNQDDGIITDGMPPNFPDHEYGNRRRGVSSDSAPAGSVPASHPFHGDVLPPLNDGRVNMTTSHGGMLQVDGTFQSVEEAVHKHHTKRQKFKARPTRRPVKVRPQLGTIKSYPVTQQVKYQLQNANIPAGSPDSDVSDSSAVLAAVGAGMIPAGMALLVPMAMSGKRKRRQIKPEFLTVSPYPNRVELTLQSSL